MYVTLYADTWRKRYKQPLRMRIAIRPTLRMHIAVARRVSYLLLAHVAKFTDPRENPPLKLAFQHGCTNCITIYVRLT